MKFIDGGSSNNIDIDADGVMSDRTIICLDLSEMLGYRLGKQIPMTANFRVNYLRIGLRNVNDANDNDGPNYFAGDWEWYNPTAHRVDAIQAWRRLENEFEADDVNTGLLQGRSQDVYTGFRFGWTDNSDISFSTAGAPSELPNGYALTKMLSEYNEALDNDGVPTKSFALWDRKVGRSSHLGFHANCDNGDGQIGESSRVFIQDGEWIAPSMHNIEVLGGLLIANITHSSPDTPQLVDDDFEVYIDVGISGWSTW